MSVSTCSTCNGTGSVESVDYDGSGYGQACPDCVARFGSLEHDAELVITARHVLQLITATPLL